jgi:diguanylate cyclase (GGDEF)-like protein
MVDALAQALEEIRQMRVLIAEDIPMARRALQSTLEGWGYEVVACKDGADAWQMLQRDDAPRLVVLDWIMPGLDGVDVCRLLRRQHAEEVPAYVLLLTAMDGTDDLVAGLEAGADDFVVKPFRPEELRARLAVGARSVELNERLAEATRRLGVLATTDELTGLPNRRAIYARVVQEIARAARDCVPLCLGMLDIDYFKRVNDTYGHAVGDAVLREVVLSAASALRPYDTIGRVGGEEFLILVPRTQGLAGRTMLARIRHTVAASPVRVEGETIPVTVSIGGAVSCGESVDGLVARADAALLQAKNTGRDRVVMAESLESPATGSGHSG